MMKQTSDTRPYFRAFYRNNVLRGVLALVLLLAGTGVGLVIAWLLGEGLDTVTTGAMDQLLHILALCLGLTLGCVLLQLAQGRLRSSFIHRALAQYKDYAFSQLTRKNISAFTRENTGRYLSVLTNDANSVEENYLNRSFLLCYEVVQFFGALGMMLWYEWRLALVSLALCALPLLVSVGMGSGLARREREVSDRNEGFVAMLQDLLRGFAVVKSFQAEDRVVERFCRSNRQLEQVKQERRWYDQILCALANGTSLLMQLGIFLLGALFAIRGQITLGTVIVFVNLSSYLLSPIQTVPQYWASRKAARGLVEKLAQVTRESTCTAGVPIPPRLEQAIVLERVGYGYEPDRPAIQDFSFRFDAGKHYALVGGSGAGKSTLLRLLMGADQGYTGSITLDGQELREVDTDSLYDLISLIDQNVFLFDDTVRNNITLFRPFPDQAVRRAVERAGLAALLEEKGEDYRCGENGVGLSGGERQRVSIARCLLRGTPVLLVDEATAALDAQTAACVTEAILDLTEVTSITVTHRLEERMLRRYDGILVLQHGALAEQGRFEELMDRRGLFYSLYTVANG